MTFEVEETDDVSEHAGSAASEPIRMVLVTGTGRSGTSTIAGTLEALGMHVPGPVRPPDDANPRGFFESKWVIEFHNSMLDRARAHTMDGDPLTLARTRRSVNAKTREQLAGFLAGAIESHPRLLVKDPRTVWFIPFWARAAASLQIEVSFLTMLRHPAEAVGSRTVHWSVSDNPERVRNRQIANLAGWINVSLLNERRTRGSRRVFVRYDDLLTDWRSTMAAVQTRLKLPYTGDPIDRRPHPVDEFIDPSLKRVAVRWDELDVPSYLSEMAERVWQAMQYLVEPRTEAAKARAQLDELRTEYDALYADARAITLDSTRAAIEFVERRHEQPAPADGSPSEASDLVDAGSQPG
ncbi:sulfotransferase family protein [Solicola gregarius]|uniref:Sulfotransferase n=1 Tax=Solicola gregarius TaxID=2908642 RepID=A0AA46YMU7_9ACTN|nr:sulfotransferase [Solicola gregarius]UYM06974.1 sulfotransferase [Solicola gregarius]